LRSARILLITFKALANEIAKNLVLAGIGALTILDHEVVTETDLAAQFLVSQENLGQNRGQAAEARLRSMNPRVQLHIDTNDIRTKEPEFYASFDIIIATDIDFLLCTTINAACRLANRPFYAAGLHGLYGYAFADLICHDFVIERAKSNVVSPTKETATRAILGITTKKENDKVIEMVKKREIYSPLLLANSSPLPEEFTRILRKRKQVTPLLSCFRALWEFERLSGGSLPAFSREDLELFTRLANEATKDLQLDQGILDASFLRSFLQNLGCEISPVAAFLGGSLAQDIINVLSAREQPLQNLLLFDGERSIAPIYSLHPIFPPQAEEFAPNTTALPMMPLFPSVD